MIEPRLLGGFFFRFMLIFTVAIVPWQPLATFTRSVFLAETRGLLALVFPHLHIEAEACQDSQHAQFDSKLTLSDPRDVRPDGQVPVKVQTFDSRSLGWMPHAVWFALCGATPMLWSRRVRLALAGLLALQVFVGGTVLTAVSFGLMEGSSPSWKGYALAALNHVLMDNLWISFVFPWLLWIIWLAQQGPLPLAFQGRRK